MSVPATDDAPRFKKKATRVQVALAKFHGMGDDEPWTLQEIANYLNVDRSTVSDYINNTDLGEEVEAQLAEGQARTRMRIAMKYLDRLDWIEDLIDGKMEEKRPAVVSHRYERVEGEVEMNKEGMKVTDEKTVKFDVPVPDAFKEIPVMDDELKTLMREWRQTAQQVEDLLGLEAPDKVESEHREEVIEAKLFKGLDTGDDGPFPAQEVRNSAPSGIEDGPEELDVETVADEDG